MVARERPVSPVVPITQPTDADVAAPGRVAANVDRAASEVGMRLLGRDGLAALLAALRESLLQSAGHCANILDLTAQQAESQR